MVTVPIFSTVFSLTSNSLKYWNSTGNESMYIELRVDCKLNNLTYVYNDMGFKNWQKFIYNDSLTFKDTVNPSINNPDDITYEVDSTGNVISWVVSDLYPSSYQVFINGVGQGLIAWNGGNLNINVDDLSVGVHTVKLWLIDMSGNSIEDEVSVNVTAKDPGNGEPPSIPGYSVTLLLCTFVFSVIFYVYKEKQGMIISNNINF